MVFYRLKRFNGARGRELRERNLQRAVSRPVPTVEDPDEDGGSLSERRLPVTKADRSRPFASLRASAFCPFFTATCPYLIHFFVVSTRTFGRVRRNNKTLSSDA